MKAAAGSPDDGKTESSWKKLRTRKKETKSTTENGEKKWEVRGG